MGLLLSNIEQNLETSGSHLRDVTLELILSWMHLSLAVSLPLVAPLSLKQMVASGFLPSLQKNAPFYSTSFNRHKLIMLMACLLAEKKSLVKVRTQCNSPTLHYLKLVGVGKRLCKY